MWQSIFQNNETLDVGEDNEETDGKNEHVDTDAKELEEKWGEEENEQEDSGHYGGGRRRRRAVGVARSEPFGGGRARLWLQAGDRGRGWDRDRHRRGDPGNPALRSRLHRRDGAS